MPAPAQPYDTAETVLNFARAITVTDAASANGLAGDILNDSQPYVFPILSKVYRDLQDELISQSSEIMNMYGYLLALEPTAWNNPRVNVTVNFQGYTYGPNDIDSTIMLPPNLIKPLELWECVTGQQRWAPMRQAADSISSRPTTSRFGIWDYQNDILILPGASQTNDLKIKYVGSFPDLTGPNSIVYILRSQTALACQFLSEVSESLGDLETAATFSKRASDARGRIVNRTARKEAYGSYNRIPFRGRHGSRRGRGY